MKAKELRIGNYIERDGNIIEVDQGCIAYEVVCPSDCIRSQPIPLTEEWIDKFGLNKGLKDSWHTYYINAPFTLCRRQNAGEVRNQYLANVKYVHQLQNLYFALTGEELEELPEISVKIKGTLDDALNALTPKNPGTPNSEGKG